MMTHVMSQRDTGWSIKSPQRVPPAEKCRLVSAMMSLNHFLAYSKFSRTATKWVLAQQKGNHNMKIQNFNRTWLEVQSLCRGCECTGLRMEEFLTVEAYQGETSSFRGRSACPPSPFRRSNRLSMGLLRLVMCPWEPPSCLVCTL